MKVLLVALGDCEFGQHFVGPTWEGVVAARAVPTSRAGFSALDKILEMVGVFVLDFEGPGASP